jgi:hypothetical protein
MKQLRIYVGLTVGLSVVLLCGCSTSYVITQNNGTRLTSVGKPKLEKGFYVYKDAHGKSWQIPQGRVREVAPASMVKDETKEFKSQTAK